jgi:Domain of unknown function (DUF4158)
VPTVQDTAYPQLKTNLSQQELDTIYTPTVDELDLAARVTKGRVASLSFLILLKVFQRLGYPVFITEVPAAIISHIAAISRLSASSQELAGYTVEPEAVAALSPYWTHHVNRFGAYQLDLKRQPPMINYEAPVVSAHVLTLMEG